MGSVFLGNAQNYDIKVFDGKLIRTKNQIDNRYREVKRIRKEFRKDLKERKKSYKLLKDSLFTDENFSEQIPKDSLKDLLNSQEALFIYTDTLHSIEEMKNWGPLKMEAKNHSIKLVEKRLGLKTYLKEYKELEEGIGSYRKELNTYKDSLKSIDSLDKEEIRFLVSEKGKELASTYEKSMEEATSKIVNERFSELPRDFQNDELSQFKNNYGYLKEGFSNPGGLKLANTQSINHFSDKTEVLEKAKESSEVLKKAYSQVNDLDDLSTATKVNSLNKSSFFDRLIFGGTFQLHLDNNTRIDLNPEISYGISKKFEVGFGGTYRLNISTKRLPQSLPNPQVMGGRLFFENQIYKNFFFHGEFEGLQSNIGLADDSINSDWYSSWMTGIERRFNLKGKLQGQVQILYNFSSVSNPLYPNPWVFRVGINKRKKD